MTKIRAVLFDLDGVLLDTEGIYTEFWSSIDRKYPTGIENFALRIKGTTLPDILEKYFPAAIHNEIRSLLADFENNMPFMLFDGAERVLVELHHRHIATAVVTSSNREKMVRVFNALPVLSENIDTLVTDEDVTASKPDPQGYILAAGRLEALPDAFAVIEDSVNGLKAARASGGKVIALATTNPRHMVEPLADIVFDDISGLDVESLLLETV